MPYIVTRPTGLQSRIRQQAIFLVGIQNDAVEQCRGELLGEPSDSRYGRGRRDCVAEG